MTRQCKEFNIPTDWMLDNNLISKVNDVLFSVLEYHCRVEFLVRHYCYLLSSPFPLVIADKICFCQIGKYVHEKSGYGTSVYGTSEQGSSTGVYVASGCEICLQNSSGNTLTVTYPKIRELKYHACIDPVLIRLAVILKENYVIHLYHNCFILTFRAICT